MAIHTSRAIIIFTISFWLLGAGLVAWITDQGPIECPLILASPILFPTLLLSTMVGPFAYVVFPLLLIFLGWMALKAWRQRNTKLAVIFASFFVVICVLVYGFQCVFSGRQDQ